MSKNYKVASLFAGIGGICLGFKQAGFDIVWANEYDTAACKTYRHNFGSTYLIEDNIKNILPEEAPDIDVITAGFPCQPFSIAGKQLGFRDKRGNLFFEITRFVDIKRPKIIFLENVANLVEHDNGRTFLVIYNSLAQFGYSVYYKVMSATEYGNLPQPRNRIYIVAVREDIATTFKHAEPIKRTVVVSDIINLNQRQNDIYYYDNTFITDNHLDESVNNDGYIYRLTDNGIRRTKDRLCPTLTANMGTFPNRVPIIKDDFGIRKLTLRECLDFQGFPKEFYFPNTITLNDAYKQIGNSVCVPVIKNIATQIRILLEETNNVL